MFTLELKIPWCIFPSVSVVIDIAVVVVIIIVPITILSYF